ncbi:6-O-methylguanine DNA methyltransferase, DNA binding domain protein [Streptococcus sp. oral taxon 056 str. F0418]|uniref:MGMT family protein n=1 Tax=Streptococcus sp. oral taxon 056 TaxID=712620 RepID=UPI0002180C82|nr:MGMT family protein [Streptococcus sp. oral taxon 056]EGP66425.1 6-O-methylguanine DNA methyltransferase, DNA binding domain protein [Streptococcus sp. oral taxon 056 str. F0418]
MSTLNQEIIQSVLDLVDAIPSGRVATYGQIARLIGQPKNARLVGRILSKSELYGGKHPCHRVVNAAGRLAPGWEDQIHLLWAEGVDLKVNGCVDLKRYQWDR